MNQQDHQTMQDLTHLWLGVQFDVASYVSAVIPDIHDAHDVVQQVAVVVINKYEQYDPTQSFRNWVLGIARLEILKYRQQQAREKLVFSQAIIDMVTEDFQNQGPEEGREQICYALRQCLKSIRGRGRQALQMWYAEQRESKKIAQELGMKENALYVMLHRVRTTLRRCVESRLAGMEESL